MIANNNDSFGKYFKRLLLRQTVHYRCFAGKNKISITAKGEIYPCDSFCGIEDFYVGSVINSEDNDFVRQLFINAHV